MAKKRNCRKSDLERELHERAIRVRKMTDEQLCNYLDSLSALKTPPPAINPDPAEVIHNFLNVLEENCGSGNGIGKSTVFKLRKFVEKEGLLNGV